jgi:hypothetical protein
MRTSGADRKWFRAAVGAGLALVAGTARTGRAMEKVEPPPSEAVLQQASNCVVNGDFETAGASGPAGWQMVENLMSFWVADEDPAHGKAMKFDTDVTIKQAYEWWARMLEGASPKDAPAKIPANGVGTLADFDGFWFWSDPFPVTPGKAYWLTADVRGPSMTVWLIGYPEKPDVSFGADAVVFQEWLRERAGEPPDNLKQSTFTHKYVWKGSLVCGGSGRWAAYARRGKHFRPTANTPGVRFLRVMIQPCAPGIYYVDNIRVVELDDPGRPR